MSLSRVESKKIKKKQKRNARNRRLNLWTINLGLLLIVIVVIVIFNRELQWISWDDLSKQMSQISERNIKKNDYTDIDQNSSLVPQSDEAVGVEGKAQEELTQPFDEDNSASVEPVEPVEPDEKIIHLSFVGDVLQGEYINTWIEKYGSSYPYEKAKSYLTSPDYTIGNLEMPITKGGTPVKGTPYVFKGDPAALSGLVDSGFDIFSLANNHALDQGVEGMRDTMKYLDEAGILHVGAGNNDTEAYQPVIIEKNGIKVALIGLSRFLPYTSWKANAYNPGLAETYDSTRALQAIEEASDQVDITVILVHWGKEGNTTPEDYQRDLSQQYIDAGADLIIGSHPHVLQGFEQLNGKWIAYSLGNFVFHSNPQAHKAYTGVLDAKCTKDAECELVFHPMKVKDAQPTPLDNEAKKEVLDYIEELSLGDVEINDDGKIISQRVK